MFNFNFIKPYYPEVEILGENLGQEWKAVTRGNLERNCSDCDAWSGNHDVFALKEKGSGVWSLRTNAYKKEICNNFKDKGVNHFKGDTFSNVRDQISDLFDSMPPPKQDITYNYRNQREGGFQSHQTTIPTLSSQSFNNSGGGCCIGESNVLMANNQYKMIKDLKKGDEVISYDEKLNIVSVYHTFFNSIMPLISAYVSKISKKCQQDVSRHSIYLNTNFKIKNILIQNEAYSKLIKWFYKCNHLCTFNTKDETRKYENYQSYFKKNIVLSCNNPLTLKNNKKIIKSCRKNTTK